MTSLVLSFPPPRFQNFELGIWGSKFHPVASFKWEKQEIELWTFCMCPLARCFPRRPDLPWTYSLFGNKQTLSLCLLFSPVFLLQFCMLPNLHLPFSGHFPIFWKSAKSAGNGGVHPVPLLSATMCYYLQCYALKCLFFIVCSKKNLNSCFDECTHERCGLLLYFIYFLHVWTGGRKGRILAHCSTYGGLRVLLHRSSSVILLIKKMGGILARGFFVTL